MTTSPDQETATPGAVPTLRDRARALAPLGWTGREADWIALVALHTGVFTRAQLSHFLDDPTRVAASRFVRTLIDKQLATEDERAIFPGGARAVLLTGKAPYRALGIPDVRHRRGKDATTHVLMRRLLSLDYLIERPALGWLPTEADKVQRFEALGVERGAFPYRKYGAPGKQIPRYFAFKLPIAVDEQAATFVYVDAGQSTDSELRAWGQAHAPLWAALRARTFAVHVVAVGTGVPSEQRAAPVLTRWTQDGDDQGAPALDTTHQSRPRNPPRNGRAPHGPDHRHAEGTGPLRRVRQGRRSHPVPGSTPRRHAHHTDGARGAIDRCTTWSTIRLISPEAAT